MVDKDLGNIVCMRYMRDRYVRRTEYRVVYLHYLNLIDWSRPSPEKWALT